MANTRAGNPDPFLGLGDVGIYLGEEAIALAAHVRIVPVDGLPALLRETGPMGDALLERVSVERWYNTLRQRLVR
jgi:hypothetical protein